MESQQTKEKKRKNYARFPLVWVTEKKREIQNKNKWFWSYHKDMSPLLWARRMSEVRNTNSERDEGKSERVHKKRWYNGEQENNTRKWKRDDTPRKCKPRDDKWKQNKQKRRRYAELTLDKKLFRKESKKSRKF